MASIRIGKHHTNIPSSDQSTCRSSKHSSLENRTQRVRERERVRMSKDGMQVIPAIGPYRDSRVLESSSEVYKWLETLAAYATLSIMSSDKADVLCTCARMARHPRRVAAPADSASARLLNHLQQRAQRGARSLPSHRDPAGLRILDGGEPACLTRPCPKTPL